MSEEIIKEIEKQNDYLKNQGFTAEQRLIINKLIANKEYLIISQLQEKEKIIEDANKILEEILVIKEGDKYRPVKNTTSQEVYKTIIKLNELLKTPNRLNYSILERK